MRLGMIVRADNTGLGNQTLELAKMLKPDKVMIIDGKGFNGNELFPERYKDYNAEINYGFLSDQTVHNFLNDIDVLISCEIFYNDNLVSIARDRGVKTILQYNYEFLDYFNNPTFPLPDYLLAPSIWMIDEVKQHFGNRSNLVYLPPAMDHKMFQKNKKNNLKNHKRILHIAGKQAFLDRNGTELVIEMLKHSTADYELVIRSQFPLDIPCDDPRVKFEINNMPNHIDMYNGFDAMVLPRKYGGLCLPMNEALLSGLPVFMTDISPNDALLPKEWLTQAQRTSQFYAKAYVQYFTADVVELAKKIDEYVNIEDKSFYKQKAFEIGYNNFSAEVLKDKYLSIIG